MFNLISSLKHARSENGVIKHVIIDSLMINFLKLLLILFNLKKMLFVSYSDRINEVSLNFNRFMIASTHRTSYATLGWIIPFQRQNKQDRD